MELYKLIDQVEKDDPFIRLVSSERLTRDVEHLMSSSYWIDQLKASKASGIGNRLFCNNNLYFKIKILKSFNYIFIYSYYFLKIARLTFFIFFVSTNI